MMQQKSLLESIRCIYKASVDNEGNVAGQVAGVRFFLEDAASVNLDWSDVGIIYMTDLAWDEPLSKLLQCCALVAHCNL